ncbi:MAG: aldo/keto reductase [Oscillospiraceae bacterium]|nr:aldo/keto reductase [Oscillospiraceae bacterium]MBQ5411879.1 aldo/keto reductase [Oscillospiraceae bacterium]
MQFQNIKGTGLKVSRFCLGTMMFGGQTSKEESIRIIDYALDNSVNFFDTADTYTGGQSEAILGEALQAKRDYAVIATKVHNPKGPLANQSGLGRKHIIQNVEESLRKLRTDYIDILYLHHPDNETPIEETIETMTQLVRSGKIRYYGVSNYSAWQCCSFVHKAREMNCIAPVITESVYNMLTRGLEDEMLPFLREYNMGLAVYNPIAAGLLSGKHSRSGPAAESRLATNAGYNGRYWKEGNLDAVEELTSIADEAGMSLLELALNWLISRKEVDSLIVGASRFEHAVQNIGIVSEPKEIPAELLARCDGVWNGIRGFYFNYH